MGWFRFLLFVAVAALAAMFAPAAEAHPNGFVTRDQFGNVVVVRSFGPSYGPVSRGFNNFHGNPRGFPPGVSPFNQDGGPNRIGRRR